MESPVSVLEDLRRENARLVAQASAVARANAHAAELMLALEEARDEISAMNTQMREILDNVAFGFLTVGADRRVGPQVTASCHTLLSTSEIAGRPFEEVMTAAPGQRLHLGLCLDEVFADLLPEELTLSQLPSRIVAGDRVLGLSGRALRDESGGVRAVLFSITDLTALEQQERESAQARSLIHILRQGEGFDFFLDDLHELMGAARGALQRGDEPTVRRAIHTVKGNCGCYGLSSVAQKVHRVEGQSHLDDAALDEVDKAIAGFLKANRDVLDAQWPRSNVGGARDFRVSGDQLDALCSTPGLPGAVTGWVTEVRQVRAGQVLGPVADLVRMVGERFEKEVELVVHGAETRIVPERLGPVLRNVAHLLSNAVVHGLEAPGERGGKPNVGTIELGIAATDDVYQLYVSDDGRGIDGDALVARALEHGLISTAVAAAMSPQDRLMLVFAQGLSTAESATEVAGRGVGMAAFREAVKKVGGSIRVRSERGCGTRFEISVPKDATAPSPEAQSAPSPKAEGAAPTAKAQRGPVVAPQRTTFDQQFILASGPEDPYRATLGLATALSAASSGMNVVCFFTMRGAKWTGNKDVQVDDVPGFPRVKDLLELLLEVGARMEACTSCVEHQLDAPCDENGRKMLATGVRYAGLSEATLRMGDTTTTVY